MHALAKPPQPQDNRPTQSTAQHHNLANVAGLCPRRPVRQQAFALKRPSQAHHSDTHVNKRSRLAAALPALHDFCNSSFYLSSAEALLHEPIKRLPIQR